MKTRSTRQEFFDVQFCLLHMVNSDGMHNVIFGILDPVGFSCASEYL